MVNVMRADVSIVIHYKQGVIWDDHDYRYYVS